MNKALVIFDMDGVLIDTEPTHAEVFTSFTGELSNGRYPLEDIHGISVPKNYQRLLDFMPEIKYTPSELSAIHFDRTWQRILRLDPGPMPGMTELINALIETGIKIAVASNSPRTFVDKALDYLGLTDKLCLVLTGEGKCSPKPAPDIYLSVLKQVGVSPDDAIVIEDSTVGIQSAKNAGLECIALCNESSSGQDASLADYKICRLDEAVKYIIK